MTPAELDQTIAMIVEKAESAGFTKFGVRSHHEAVGVGSGLGVSYDQFDDCEEEELEGICCIRLNYEAWIVVNVDDTVNTVRQVYPRSGPTVLVGGTGGYHGNDEGEIVISGAEVLWVFD